MKNEQLRSGGATELGGYLGLFLRLMEVSAPLFSFQRILRYHHAEYRIDGPPNT